MTRSYRPRISVEITPEQQASLFNIIPHGMQKPLFQTLVNGIITIHREGGIQALGAITSEYLSINQIATIGLNSTRENAIIELTQALEKLTNGHD